MLPLSALRVASIQRHGASKSVLPALTRLFSQQQPSFEEYIDFGFRNVLRGEKASLVANVFSNVASSYDVMNDLMSGGMHRCWKEQLVDTLRPFPGMHHLDVAGGTGDVAFRVLRAIRQAEARSGQPPPTRPSPPSSSSSSHGHAATSSSHPEAHPSSEQASSMSTATQGVQGQDASSGSGGLGTSGSSSTTSTPQSMPHSHHQQHQQHAHDASAAGPGPGSLRGSVTVCDINPDMLAEGKKKASAARDLAVDEGLHFEVGNAEALGQFRDAQFDAYTIAFGIRNVTDREAALAEAYRVLKPGGRFLCLEFSQVSQPLLRQMYDAYSFAVIPRIGGLVAGDADSYQYLVESIRQFPDQETFAGMIEDAGFQEVGYENVLGGVVAMHSGYKLD